MMMDLQSNQSSYESSLSIISGHFCHHAEVVKLANTLRSGRSGRKSVRVELPPSAGLWIRELDKLRFSENQNLSVGLRRPQKSEMIFSGNHGAYINNEI